MCIHGPTITEEWVWTLESTHSTARHTMDSVLIHRQHQTLKASGERNDLGQSTRRPSDPWDIPVTTQPLDWTHFYHNFLCFPCFVGGQVQPNTISSRYVYCWPCWSIPLGHYTDHLNSSHYMCQNNRQAKGARDVNNFYFLNLSAKNRGTKKHRFYTLMKQMTSYHDTMSSLWRKYI